MVNNVPEREASTIQDHEQRDNTRYACHGSVEFYIDGSEVRTFATLSDISFAGCYVEMTATSSPGTRLNLVIEILGACFRAKGIVKTSYPCLGMGIEFTEIAAVDRDCLSEVLRSLAAQSQGATVNSASQAFAEIVLPSNVDAGAVLDALAKCFRNRASVTRNEFLLHVARNVHKKS